MMHRIDIDAVWSNMPSADRIVLAGHDRNELDDADRARLLAIVSKRAQKPKTPAPA
jgi:hypothetical protein